jgi:hypothetical protein
MRRIGILACVPLCVVGPSSASAAKAGWRPGLSFKVHVNMEVELRGEGPPQRAAIEARYRIRTVKDGPGFRVGIEDGVLVSADGAPELKRRLLRDAAFMRSNPTFRVRKSGDFDGSIDAEATLARLRAAFAADPELAAFENPTVFRQDVLDRWLMQVWDAFRAGPGSAGAFSVTLADGFVARGKGLDSHALATTCPGSFLKCQEYIRVFRIDSEEMRAHMEHVLSAARMRQIAVHSYAEKVRTESFVGQDGLPVAIQTTEEKRMNVALELGDSDVVTVTTSRLTFAR